MDRVTPPESTDWMDRLTGLLVLLAGTVVGSYAPGVLAYW